MCSHAALIVYSYYTEVVPPKQFQTSSKCHQMQSQKSRNFKSGGACPPDPKGDPKVHVATRKEPSPPVQSLAMGLVTSCKLPKEKNVNGIQCSMNTVTVIMICLTASVMYMYNIMQVQSKIVCCTTVQWEIFEKSNFEKLNPRNKFNCTV